MSKGNPMYNGLGYYDPTAYQAIMNVAKGEYNMEIYRGDIFYVKKTGNITDSEQDSGRPAVIVSNDQGDEHAPVVEIVYLTTQQKNPLPTHCQVICKTKSTALCEQIYTVSKNRLGDYIKTCTSDEMAAIDQCLMVSLALNSEQIPAIFDEKLIDDLKTKIDDLTMKLEGAERELDESEAEYRKVMTEYNKVVNTNSGLIDELESLKNQSIFPEDYDPHKVTVLTTERDLYKRLYEQTLERLITK